VKIRDNGFDWARKITLVMKSRENSLAVPKGAGSTEMFIRRVY